MAAARHRTRPLASARRLLWAARCRRRGSTPRTDSQLVNGSPGILDSLSFVGGAIPPELEKAYQTGGYCEVTLVEPPLAVNVRVGGNSSPKGSAPGTAPGSVLWHGVELDDLSCLITSLTKDAQVISLLMSSNPEKVQTLAATEGVPEMDASCDEP